MNYRLGIIILIFNVFQAQAQSKLISGKVIVDNIDNSTELNVISVVNNSSGAKTKTNFQGFFSIKVELNENLEFNGFGLEKRELKIIQQILDKGYLEVHMNEEIINLNEVNLLTLDKNLKNNIKLKYDNIDELYKGLNLGIDPNLRFRKIDPNATSMTGNVGLSNPAAWIATISGQRKREKKQQEYFTKLRKTKDLENYFTKNYFIENLHIPESKVNDFVTYCYANFELEKLIKENNYDKITQVLEDQAPKYLEMLSKKSS